MGYEMSKFIRIFQPRTFYAKLSKLRPASIEVLGLISGVTDWVDGTAFIEKPEIAATLALGDRTVTRAVSELVDAGFIAKRGGCYAVNPLYMWGGRSWNMAKAEYYRITKTSSKNVVSLAESASIDDEEIERVGHETLREVTARKRKGNKTC